MGTPIGVDGADGRLEDHAERREHEEEPQLCLHAEVVRDAERAAETERDVVETRDLVGVDALKTEPFGQPFVDVFAEIAEPSDFFRSQTVTWSARVHLAS